MIAGAWAGPSGFGAALEQPPVDASRLVLVPPGQVPAGARIVGIVVETAAPQRLGVVVDRPVPIPRVPEPVLEDSPWQAVRPGLLLDREGRVVLRDGVVVRFTRREYDLFEYVATRPGRVLSRDQLLRTVWELPDPRFAGARTVDVHVVRLRRKLDRHAPALETVRGVGYRWVP